MNKKLIVFSVACLLVLGCKSESQEQVEEMTMSNSEKTGVQSNVPNPDNDYLVSIYEAQELIKIEQENVDLRRSYCDKAYFKDTGYFISMGIARKKHPETGESIPPSLIQRSAQIDAMRWAAYGMSWLSNNYQPAFGKIEAQLNQNVTVLNQANVGDSLFVFIATKVN